MKVVRFQADAPQQRCPKFALTGRCEGSKSLLGYVDNHNLLLAG